MKFEISWSKSLKITTAISVAVLMVLPLLSLLSISDNSNVWYIGIIIVPLLIFFIAVFFIILGYEVIGDTLFVKRLGWRSEIQLHDLESVYTDPEAMKRSLRTFGNGGLFCIAGKFRNKKLGPYRAFATDPESAVVLKFKNKLVVVTPTKTEEFVKHINSIITKV